MGQLVGVNCREGGKRGQGFVEEFRGNERTSLCDGEIKSNQAVGKPWGAGNDQQECERAIETSSQNLKVRRSSLGGTLCSKVRNSDQV
jgi:hypothetical protein